MHLLGHRGEGECRSSHEPRWKGMVVKFYNGGRFVFGIGVKMMTGVIFDIDAQSSKILPGPLRFRQRLSMNPAFGLFAQKGGAVG